MKNTTCLFAVILSEAEGSFATEALDGVAVRSFDFAQDDSNDAQMTVM